MIREPRNTDTALKYLYQAVLYPLTPAETNYLGLLVPVVVGLGGCCPP